MTFYDINEEYKDNNVKSSIAFSAGLQQLK